MQRELSTFPFPPTLRAKLIKAGFRTLKDIEGVGLVELSKETGCSHEEAHLILKTIKGESTNNNNNNITINPNANPSNDEYNEEFQSSFKVDATPSQGKSAFELLQKENTLSPIITFSNDIDEMLGGGVERGKMTEFCGVPGIGKTQIAMQLAVDVAIPSLFNGAEGSCIYIDTEGSFVIDRFAEMALALVNHLHDMTENSEEEHRIIAHNVTLDSILESTYYWRIHHFIEQIALVNLLPDFLSTHPTVRLVIIDSITFHFRRDFEDMANRTRLLNQMAQNLMSIAEKYDVAVVLTNQVTTKVSNDSKDAILVPALGESWGHNCTNRIILYYSNFQRFAHLYKSPSKKAITVPFQVTSDGIRGPDYIPRVTQTSTFDNNNNNNVNNNNNNNNNNSFNNNIILTNHNTNIANNDHDDDGNNLSRKRKSDNNDDSDASQ